MSDLDDLRRQLAQLQEQVQMEAGLRAGADTDLSRISTRSDPARHLLQALALTQSEQADVLRDHTDRLVRLEQKADAAAQQLQVITSLLNGLIDKADGQ